MRIKSVNRNIPEDRENTNDRFRVRYKDKYTFDILEVNICRLKTNQILTYEFESEDLPDKDSIHFTTYVNNKDEFSVEWKGMDSESKATVSFQKLKKNHNVLNEKPEILYSESFSPIVGNKPKVLVLGTLPGNESIRLNQYYANSRNVFWKIIYKLLNDSINVEYEKRIEFLKKNNIAIWDVCYKGMRKSSLDSDISNEVPNNIDNIILKYPTIKLIVFNGQKANKLYEKYFKRFDNIDYVTLLSTSPANTSSSFDEKLKDWSIILNYLT